MNKEKFNKIYKKTIKIGMMILGLLRLVLIFIFNLVLALTRKTFFFTKDLIVKFLNSKFYKRNKKIFLLFIKRKKKILFALFKKKKKIFLKFCKKENKKIRKYYFKFINRNEALKKINSFLAIAFGFLLGLLIIFRNKIVIFSQILWRNFSNLFVQKLWFRVSTFSVLGMILVFIVFSNKNISAATYTFIQNNWSGGASSDMATHPNDQSMWNKFFSKDDNMEIVDGGGGLRIGLFSSSLEQNNLDNLSSGSFNQVENNSFSGNSSLSIKKSNFTSPVIGASNSQDSVVLVKSDGTLWSWGFGGFNFFGLGGGEFEEYPIPSVISAERQYLENIISVSASTYKTIALSSDGHVWQWGGSAVGTNPNRVLDVDNSSLLSDIVKINAAPSCSYALKSDGTVYSFANSNNNSGCLGDGTFVAKTGTHQVVGPLGDGFLTDIIDIVSYGQTAYALKSNGTVWSWGSDSNGSLGAGTNYNDSSYPVQVLDTTGNSFLENIVMIAAGDSHALALDSFGVVYAWGRNNYGQLGTSPNDKLYPSRVLGEDGSGFLENIRYISAGYRRSMAISNDGSVFAWGENLYGKLGVGSSYTSIRNPSKVISEDGDGYLQDVSMISLARDSSYAIKNNGEVLSWGRNNNGQLGTGNRDDRNIPGLVLSNELEVFNVSSGSEIITKGSEGSIFVFDKNVNKVYSWGNNTWSVLGYTNTAQVRPRETMYEGLGSYIPNLDKLVFCGIHVLALDSNQNVWSFGNNFFGQLGDGSNSNSNVPVQVLGLNGNDHLSGVTDIYCSRGSSYALLSDNSLLAWGSNNKGQLGNGAGANNNNNDDKNFPVQVLDTDGSTPLSGISQFSTGSNSAYVLKSNGDLLAWGENNLGQLSDGSYIDRNIPVQMNGLNDIVYIYANGIWQGGVFFAIDSSGYVWALGRNKSGALGVGDKSNKNVPTRVLGVDGSGFLSGVSSIVSDANITTLALSNSGEVFSWGSNFNGQLGIGGFGGESLYPVRVRNSDDSGYLDNINSIGLSSATAHAIDNFGNIWSWGSGWNYTLGDNTRIHVSLPVKPVISSNSISNFNVGYDSYYLSGAYTSPVIDLGKKSASFSTLDIDNDIPTGTAITIDVRAGNDSDPLDSSWTEWTNGLSNGSDISFLGSKRYVQYRANLSTSNNQLTPTLNNIIFNYQYYPTNQTLLSSKYDTLDSTNIIGIVGMNEGDILPEGTEAILSIKTAPTAEGLDSATWHDFTGSSSGCSKEGGKFTCSSLPSDLMSGEDDRFWQYKVTLNSDGSNTPTISEVEVKYVVNAPPEVQNVVASQNEDGLVDISYEVRDIDALSGSYTPGKVLPSFEYYDNGSWVLCETLSSGAKDLKSVEMEAFTTYSLTWDAKADFNGNYIENMKIRVGVNDGEAANNTSQAESGYFSLDTKDPIVTNFSIDGRSDSVNNLNVEVNDDDPNLKIKLSNNSNLSPDGLNPNSGLWIDVYSPMSWIFTSAPSPTVYYQVKDSFGNISNAGQIWAVSAPSRPLNIIFQDVSNVSTSEWREFIAWGQSPILPLGFKQYNIYRSTDGENFSLITTQSDRLSNFILDSGLDTSNIYYYKVAVEDNAGNISGYSDVIFDRPDGQGGTDLTPPVISGVEISNITAQSALITWDTDEPSSSLVAYITDEFGDFDYALSVGVSSMSDNSSRLGRHSVFLNHLEPGTTYYVRVSSADPSSNSSFEDGFSFTTLDGPIISNVESSNITNSSAVITWNSSVPADSRVFYSDNINMTNPTEVAVSGDNTSHSIQLTGLENGVRYYFYVKSSVAEDKNIVDGEQVYYNFLTTSDVTAPQIIFDPNTDIFDRQENSIRISWVTDELAISTIEYSVDDSYDSFFTNSNFNTNHSFELSGLEKGTTYNFRLKSADSNNNLRVLSGLSFTTADLSDVTAPIISDVLAKQVADVSALITWRTDEPADSKVEYGIVSDDHDSIATSSALNYSHSVLLKNLNIKTTYYFKVSSSDASENSASSEEYSFTTQDALVAGATSTTIIVKEGGGVLVIDKSDNVKPEISNARVIDIGLNRATISWQTNEPANSVVEFGLNKKYEQASIDLRMNENHSRTLVNLSPKTVYYYKISSTDASGNISDFEIGEFTTLSLDDVEDLDDLLDFDDLDPGSEERDDGFDEIISPEEQARNDDNFMEILRRTFSFIRQAAKSVSSSILESSLLEQQEAIMELANMTDPPKIISGPIINVWEDMAIITWETDKKTGSLVAVTEDGVPFSSYDLVQNFGNPDVYSNEHQVIISGLKPATSYNYQLRGNTQIGSRVLSAPDTFTTLSKTAKIENYVVDRLNNESASFKWTSSLPTNSLVRVIPYRNGSLSMDEAVAVSSDRMTTIHEITVDNLESGVFYRVDLSGRDSTGQVLSQTIESFSTSNEAMPFIIEQVKTSSALAGAEGLRVQSIISWNTSKLSTSKVYYRKGIGQDDGNWPFETLLDPAYTRRHLVVITDFLPGEVYQFQVESEDSNGDKIRSNTYTILTPRQRESVFQVILKNIEQTFGWMGTFNR